MAVTPRTIPTTKRDDQNQWSNIYCMQTIANALDLDIASGYIVDSA